MGSEWGKVRVAVAQEVAEVEETAQGFCLPLQPPGQLTITHLQEAENRMEKIIATNVYSHH